MYYCCWLAAGWVVGDAIVGRYLNPRIWNVDLKMFLLWHIGLIGHLTVCAVTFVEAYQREKMNTAMMLMASYTIVADITLAVFQVCRYRIMLCTYVCFMYWDVE